MKPVDIAAPVSDLINELQDISGALALANKPAASIAQEYVDAGDGLMFPAEAWGMIKRKTALSAGFICEITQLELDRLIIGHTKAGMLIASYQNSIGATVYRRPDGSVLGMSVYGRHFCHRDVRPIQSPTLHVQCLGRSKRQSPAREVIQWSPDSLPLLTREGGAGEGASMMTTAMLAKYFGVPLNIGGPINTALLTGGIETPSVDANGDAVVLTFRNSDGSEAQL
jgi:hypothetical protein